MTEPDEEIPIFIEPFEDAASLMPVSDVEAVERQSWYIHKGTEICVRNFCNLQGDEAARLAELHGEWMRRNDRNDVRLMLDVTGGIANKRVVDAFKRNAKRNAHRYRKVAVVGATGVLEFFLQVVNKFSNIGGKPFKTRAEAIDWLVEP